MPGHDPFEARGGSLRPPGVQVIVTRPQMVGSKVIYSKVVVT